MKEILRRVACSIVFFIACISILNITKQNLITASDEYADLVIYGDNIDSDRKAFVDNENGGIYLPFSVISKVIDDKIYYDKSSTKVIITTDSKVIKLKIDENVMTENFEEKEILTPAKLYNGFVYIDINLLKDVYGILVDYNEDTKTISIDKTSNKSNVKYNRSYVYSDITTDSCVLEKLDKGNSVIVYDKSLNHNRWYKVKTENNVIGYISKNDVDFSSNSDDNIVNKNSDNGNKYTMFWQYGSNIKTLGEKIDGVNVVAPTWFELSGVDGQISSKYSSDYYTKAKENGYEIWPVITNGIDSVNYDPEETSMMLNSEYARECFIKNLLEICTENNLDGINMDFESMKTEDRDVYTQLIKEMSPIFRNNGIKVSVDTYFVEYIDRKNVGAACDYIILMGYDHRGSWSSVSGPIAEIPWVESNIDSLINDSEIPSSKIILGVPFYTRLWIEKENEDKPSTKVYTMQDCIDFMEEYGLTSSFDEESGQNYVEYQKGSITYKLWIEDETSVKERVNLVNKYNLAGISGWRKGLETEGIWNVIKENMT